MGTIGATPASLPPGARRRIRETAQAVAAAAFSLVLALSTPLAGLGAQMAWADDGQASFDVVEDGDASQAPSDPAADQTGSLDPPAEEPSEPAQPSQGTGGMGVTEDGAADSPAQPSQPSTPSQGTGATVTEDGASSAQPGQSQAAASDPAQPSQDDAAKAGDALKGVTATLGAYDMDMGVQYTTLTVSGLTGPATLTVKADGSSVLARAATGVEYDAAAGVYLAVVELPVEGDGTYELDGVQPMGVEEVSATLSDGTSAVLLDRAAVEQQLAQIPATYSYANLGQITLGANGDYGQIHVGQTSGGITWTYVWKTWNGYRTQCITPTASAGYDFARDTTMWASNDSVAFYEYVASRASMADTVGVPASDPGRQAVQALASQIECDGDPLFAAEHFIMSCALRMQVDHGRTVFDNTDADAAWNADWIRQAACDSLSGTNAAWDAPMWLQLSSSLDFDASAVQVAKALHVLWQQYQSKGYAALMNGITAQSWIGFYNSTTAYNSGAQHVMGYKLSGRLVTTTSLTVSKESNYSSGSWTALKKAVTWKLVSVDGDSEGKTYDQTLSSKDGTATVTFTGVPNGTQFRLYEVKAPTDYTARERIGLYTDGTGAWTVWNQEKGAWDNSVWKVTSAGKTVYTGLTGSGSSTVLHVMDAPVPPSNGKLELYKVSAKPEVTTGNVSYSLQGAQYGVYSDQGCTKLVTTLTTGTDGHAVSGDLPAGTYWVKETKPSPGYALDTGIYKVTVSANKTTRVGGDKATLKEQPQADPVIVTVQKVDSKTGQKLPQGSASLEGAQFTVRYYAGQYSKSNLPSKATRTWVIKTDKNGFAGLSNTYKVSGDDFYTFNGVVQVPLGTITVQETKAPAGYTVNSEVFVRNIKADGSGLTYVNVDMTFEIPETPLMGGLSVQKASSGDLPEGASLAGVEFQVFNASAQAVSVGGKSYAPETADTVAAGTAKPILTLTTDAKGYAATAADALPFGTYIVHESNVPASTGLVATAADQTVTVAEAGKVTPCAQAFVNDLARAGLSVQKLDAQTADGSAQGSATLAGASFEVRDSKGDVVLTLGATDGNGRAATSADALPLGTYTVTEAKAPEGYGLPEGGAASQTVKLSKPGEVVAVQVPWRDPVLRGGVSVQKADVETGATTTQGAASFKGAEFQVASDNEQAVVVGGTSYSKGDVVATLVTDGSGSAATAADLLPVGAYTVRETKAPEGYLLNDTEWQVVVAAGAVTPVGSADGAASQSGDGFDPLAALSSLLSPSTAQAAEADDAGDGAAAQAGGASVAEQVVRGGVRVYKVDADKGTGSAQGDATLEGTEFTIATMNRNPVVVDGVTYEYGSDVKKIYTDKEGVAQTGERDLPYGVYTVRETSAPVGYYDMGQMFEVTQDGVIVEVGEKFKDDVKRGGVAVQKVDAETADGRAQGSATLAGTVFEVVNASQAEVVVDGYYYDPDEVVTTLVTDETGYASTGDSYLPYGTYKVREAQAPSGYLDGEEGFEQVVEVREGGVTVACAESFANQVKRGGLSLHKADAETADGAQGAATLAGAEFNVYNSNSQEVVVGGVEYAPDDVVMTLTTDGAGDASTGARDLPVGTYTVAEVKAPEGYDPDPAAQTVTVTEDGATVACGSSFKDQVLRGGFGLRKVDSETGASKAQGDASLAGAAFEVVNANGQDVVVDGVAYGEGEVVATIETDADGWAQVPAGSLPYGTYTVTEVDAPSGYRVGGADADGALTGEGTSFDVTVSSKGWWHSYEAGEMSDQVVRGGLSLQKVDADGVDGTAQGAATLAGAQFEVANASAADVVVDGESYAPGEAILTLTTDESGRASTGARDLPYGTYSVREVASPDGYNPGDGTVQLVEVRSEGQVVACGDAFADEVMRGGFGLRKADSETGASEAQGDATLAGAVFEVTSDNDQPVVVGGKSYGRGEVVATIETDEGGWAQVPAKSLPYGDYTVTEVASPSGYRVGEADADGALTGGGTSFAVTVSGQGWWSSYESGEMSDQVARGGLSLHKADAETVDGAAQGAGTLAGAEFEVVNASKAAVRVNGASYAPGDVVMTLVTDEAGDASTGARDLPYGTYKVREKTPPEGYAADSGEQTVAVRAEGATVACGSSFKDRVLRGGASVGKTDSELGAAQAQGAATLQGAVFEVVSDNGQTVVVGGQAYRKGDVVARIVTDATGSGATAADALPYGTYKVREAKAPQGYLVNKTVWTVVVGAAGQVVAVGDASGDPNPGAQSDEGGAGALPGGGAVVTAAPEGDAAADGTAEGDGAEQGGFDPLAALASVVGPSTADAAEADAFYVGEDGDASEPGPDGTDGAAAAAGEDLEGAPAAAGAPGAVVPERVVRGDIQLVKVREDGMSTLAGVPFLVTSETTGESHVVVTDASGRFDSAAAPHSSSTNASDAAYDAATGAVDDSLLDPSAGVWFSGARSGGAAPDDTRGALPYDTYAMEELPCAANAGLRMVSLTFTVAADSVKVDMGAVADRAAPSLATELTEAAGGHDAWAQGEATLVDAVAYDHFDQGGYTAEMELFLDDGTPLLGADGQPVAASAEFSAEGESGTFEVSATFDCSGLAGRSVTAYETVRDASGAEVASHRDLGDAGQTVAFHGMPSISTALAGEDGSKVVGAEGGRVKLVDTVSYSGLVPGRTYSLAGSLVDRATGEALLGADGQPVAASAELVPESADGQAEVAFDLDAALVAGRSLVCFETLSEGGVELASHADPADEGQTAWVPSLATSLTDAASGTRMAVAAEGARLVDAVSYAGLRPGGTYTVTGTLVDAETGTPLLGADDEPVTASAEFTAEGESGTVEVAFDLDASALAGRTLVAFETLSESGREVASHADAADAAQTVRFPSLETEFATTDGSHAVMGDGAHDLADTVEWSNVEPGGSYRLVCTLADPQTGEHLRRADTGDKYEASADFTAEAASGTATVPFPGLTGLADCRAVALESLYALAADGQTWVEVGRHRDVADSAQTVSFGMPVIRTELAAASTGLHEVGVSSKVELVDTVSYEGMEAGATYTLRGTLMDKSTGEALISRGEKVEASAEFTAEAASGTAQVAFSFDATDLGGKRVVAYEVAERDGAVVASHESMDDADQTVSLVSLRTTATDASDGDHEVAAAAKATLADRVEVKGLEAGATYTIETELADAQTKAAVASSSAQVSPSKADTAFTVKAEVDTSKLAGRDLVFLETLKRDGKVVAQHRDYSDVGQTVKVGPAIATELTDAAAGTHEPAPGQVELLDTVSYSGLTPGAAYTLSGELRYTDGTAVAGADGKAVTATAQLTPASADGTAQVRFAFDASAMPDGTKVVAFETLADANGRTAAEHRDLSDESQTVTFRSPSSPQQPAGTTTVTGTMPQTGQGLLWAVGIVAGLAALFLGGFYALRGRLPFARRADDGAPGAEAQEAGPEAGSSPDGEGGGGADA